MSTNTIINTAIMSSFTRASCGNGSNNPLDSPSLKC
jgi:hypothetical protein